MNPEQKLHSSSSFRLLSLYLPSNLCHYGKQSKECMTHDLWRCSNWDQGKERKGLALWAADGILGARRARHRSRLTFRQEHVPLQLKEWTWDSRQTSHRLERCQLPERECGFFVSSQLLITKMCVQFSRLSFGKKWMNSNRSHITEWTLVGLRCDSLRASVSRCGEAVKCCSLNAGLPGCPVWRLWSSQPHSKSSFSMFSNFWGCSCLNTKALKLYVLFTSSGVLEGNKTQARWFKWRHRGEVMPPMGAGRANPHTPGETVVTAGSPGAHRSFVLVILNINNYFPKQLTGVRRKA